MIWCADQSIRYTYNDNNFHNILELAVIQNLIANQTVQGIKSLPGFCMDDFQFMFN